MLLPRTLWSKARSAARFLRKDEEGGVTIEYVLWLPIWVLIMTLTVDATLLFHQRSQFFVAARDMSRLVAVGAKTTAEAQSMIEAAYSGVNGFQASVTETDGFVTTHLSAPFESFTHLSGRFVGGTLNSSVTMYVEGAA